MSSPRIEVLTIESLPFGENTYVAWLEGRDDCLIVDAGLEPRKIVHAVEARKLRPAALLCTHGHADHIGGNEYLKRIWPEVPIVTGKNEAQMLVDARLNMSAVFGVPVTSPPADILLADGESFSAAGFELQVYEIPGHSRGHIVFVWRGASPYQVFGGDVLFAGSIGRTDFPGGSFEQLAAGIHHRLFTLPDDTVVWPGHGPATTTGREKRTNPFVGEAAGIYGIDDI
ncbi:MAG: MBL fold metallo-hydrolase [Pirellulales bacterium]|nr:MBL fold metallo-hydrolase [Pirellulales bacterium]